MKRFKILFLSSYQGFSQNYCIAAAAAAAIVKIINVKKWFLCKTEVLMKKLLIVAIMVLSGSIHGNYGQYCCVSSYWKSPLYSNKPCDDIGANYALYSSVCTSTTPMYGSWIIIGDEKLPPFAYSRILPIDCQLTRLQDQLLFFLYYKIPSAKYSKPSPSFLEETHPYDLP